MNLNITVNESGGSTTQTPGTFYVRAHFNETDSGHLSGPFGTREAAEQCATVLAARPGTLKVGIEEGE